MGRRISYIAEWECLLWSLYHCGCLGNLRRNIKWFLDVLRKFKCLFKGYAPGVCCIPILLGSPALLKFQTVNILNCVSSDARDQYLGGKRLDPTDLFTSHSQILLLTTTHIPHSFCQ